MSYVTFLVGLLLSACGGYAMSFGWGIVAVERGWASMISGAVLLSGGVVVMALALVMRGVARLRAALLAQARPSAPAAAPQPAPAQDEAPEALAFQPPAEDEAPPHALIEDVRRVVAQSIKGRPLRPAEDETPAAATGADAAAPSRLEAEVTRENAAPAEYAWPRDAGRFEAAVRPEPRPAGPVSPPPPSPGPSWSAPPSPAPPASGPSTGDAFRWPAPESAGGAAQAQPAEARPPERRPAAPPRAPAREFHLPRAVGLEGVAPGLAPRQPGAAVAAAPAAALASPEAAGDPMILGRHESEGTSYVMYADGSIEATSGRGVFRFGSMAELKAFMESQPRG
ncbi:hypothetical protein [Methylocella sp.]|uniref:hypothetical protein n=1 Tax=Methylocella sp. TaxID=1978226 RepID=UPI003783BC82